MNTDLAGSLPDAAACAADDNEPMKAVDFPSIAARRSWVDSLPEERVRITTTPTKKRLTAANDNDRLAALAVVEALLAPHVPDCLPDPLEPMDKAAVGDGWRMRPEIPEIERAMASRVAVRTACGRTHAERWKHRTWHIGPLTFTMSPRAERAPILVEGKVVTGNLRIPAGAMIERGQSRNGMLKPSEYRTFEKPAAEAKRTATTIRSYIKLAGAQDPEPFRRVPIQPLPSGRTPYMQGREDRAVLASAELAAAYRNTPVPPSITYLPVGYADPEGFFADVSNIHGGGSSHDGHARRAHDEAVRIIVQKWLVENLDGEDFRILSLATSSATASDAGADLRMTRQRYVRAADAALEKVAKLLAA